MTLTLCRRCIFDLPAVVCWWCIQRSAHLDLNTPASRNTRNSPMLRSLITVVPKRSRPVMKLSACKHVPSPSLSLSLSLPLLKLFLYAQIYLHEITKRDGICLAVEKSIPIYNSLSCNN